MKITKDYQIEFTPIEALCVLLGRVSVCNNNFSLFKTRNKRKMLAYLYGQNEALRVKLNKNEEEIRI